MNSNHPPCNTQAVAYLRGREQSQLDEQLTAIRERAQHNGDTITRVYTDTSASPGNYLNRDQMLADAATGNFSAVYVHRFDRLTRNMAELTRIVKQLHQSGVGVKSVIQSLDLTRPEGRLVIAMLDALASEFSKPQRRTMRNS